MAELMKKWLRARLGVIMDLSPEKFGHYTRDGTLLAQILHSYDIISSNQLSTIVRTYDPALCRVNLKTLRIWLRLINVTMRDKCIEEISEGKGAAALHLFYKVYLSLEGKDRLHFIALQKEREKLIPASDRFDVIKIPDEPAPYQPAEHPLSKPLIEAADTIFWHRSKFWKIVEACKEERRRFEAAVKYPVAESFEHFVLEATPDDKQRENKKLDEFARRHPAPREAKKKSRRLIECCPQKKVLVASFLEEPVSAAEYIDFLRKRGERAVEWHRWKTKIQKTMMADAWEKLLRQQDRSFDEALGMRVLDQSRYEKQMMRKLCEVRDVRNRIVENRRIVDAMLLRVMESEQRLKEDRRVEVTAAEMEEAEMERHRMRELRRRIYEEKLRTLRKQHHGICAEVAADLADMAVKIVSYRQAKDNDVPHSVWTDLRTSFLKSLPVFGFTEHFDFFKIENTAVEEENSLGELEGAETRRTMKSESYRRNVAVDVDFENYRNLAPPWDEFLPSGEEETEEEVVRLGRVVLGHAVHRLLEVLYYRPIEVATCPVPRVKVAAVVLGITDSLLHEQLRELLKKNDIHLLRMENAINHCLERYKWEMADAEYIDLDIVAATARDNKRLEAKSKMDDPRDRHSKLLERKRATAQRRDTVEEKQTQTPKRIPYDDMHPTLSDTAYIGKWTYEFLMLGQPIPDELNTKILIEQFKGIGAVEGWVIVNYPNTREQMAMLEKALTGHEVPLDRKVVDFTDVNIENIDPPSPRIIFNDDETRALETCRQSRLLPNPLIRQKSRRHFPSTFMTLYIKAMFRPKSLDVQDEPRMLLPHDATLMDEYYADQDIAYGFYYNVLNFAAIEELSEFIAREGRCLNLSEEIPRTQQRESTVDSKAVVIKRWIPKAKWESSQRDERADLSETESIRDLQPETKARSANTSARPGEKDWQWAKLSQPSVLLEILATLWESIEESYVENLKEILALKRFHTAAVMPYKDLILKNLTRLVDRPDKRQELLHNFQRAFNTIDGDLRQDPDMKHELHCRIVDFRAELWELCDARRHEAEEERKRVLQSQWVPVESAVLVGVYVEILQTEADRFVDTMQLLQDYYSSMLQLPLQESRFSKVLLDRVELAQLRETSNSRKASEGSMGAEEERRAPETKVGLIEGLARVANVDRFKSEIESLLTDASKSFDPDQNSVYDAVKAAIRQVRNAVDSVSSIMTQTLQRARKNVTPKAEVKPRGGGNHRADSVLARLTANGENSVEEWRYAASYEVHRIGRILDVLSAAARSDVTFLLDTMRRAFHRVHRYIVERYEREIESIGEAANVFRFAVEEARPIHQELLLDGDRLVVRPNVLLLPDEPRVTIQIAEAPSPLRFRVIQLARLLDIFRRVAPRDATMSERALVYILQDLVSCGEEDCYPPSVPCAWQQLRASDIESLIAQLFGTTDYIEWREFIVYALDLPVPSHLDILKTQDAFRMQDPESREMITRDQYRSTSLWFLENVKISAGAVRAAHENLHGDHEAFPNEELHCGNYEIMNVMLREAARLGARAATDSSLKRDLIEPGNSSDTLRLMLAKELLGHVFAVNHDAINYTAMLLAFCKDEDPREGLGKAFTLAMGQRVCTDTTEGERYVEELVKMKRRAKETQLSRAEANEVVREIVEHLISRAQKSAAVFEKRRSLEQTSKLRIMIQQLDGFTEIDPASLLPPEVTLEHLVIEDMSVTSDEHEYEPSLVLAPSVVSEDYEKVQRDERVVYWLPRSVCLTVLAVCLPWYASQANLFHTSLSLREKIERVYDELKDKELSEEDAVLVHRLLNHDFICELLFASGKFTSRNVAALLRDILKGRDKF